MSNQKKFRSLSELSDLLPPSENQAQSGVEHPARLAHDGKGKTVRVMSETKGRKGKTVTIVAGLQHNPDTLEMIARILKQHCGAGGTVKEGVIEIQGDNRVRVAEKLRSLNYAVKG